MKKNLAVWNLIIYGVLFIFFALSMPYGDEFFLTVVSRRIEILNSQVVWLTTYGFAVAFAMLGVLMYYSHRIKKSHFIVFLLCLFSTFFLTYFFKFVFQESRPYELFEITPLIQERTLSFPSAHSALAFCLLPMLMALDYPLAIFWGLVATLISFSRVYLGVHLPQEVLAGALLGFAVGDVWRVALTRWNFLRIWDKYLELRRQTFHAIFGLTLALFLRWELIPINFLLILAILGVGLSLLARQYKIPVIDYLLHRYERPYLLKVFPGRGMIFYVFSCYLALRLFDFNIALACMLILALMDSTAHLVGKYWGRVKNPLNPKKDVEGFVVGLLVGVLGALYFVPFELALFGAFAGSFVEIFELKIGRFKIDDNLTIPLVAGAVMTLVSWYG